MPFVNSTIRRIVIETRQRVGCHHQRRNRGRRISRLVGETCWIESRNAGAADVEAVERDYGEDGGRDGSGAG